VAAPGPPLDLTASPAGWHNSIDVAVDWTNPPDPSGIAAAWYKVGSIPLSLNDGTRSTSKPLLAAATAEGGQSLYLWLEDGVGNRDHTASATITLYYDATAPSNGRISIANGAATTASPIVTLDSLRAEDAGGSGLLHMRFCNDTSAWSSWESFGPTRSGWDLTPGGGAADIGERTVYVQYKDAAGNVSAMASDKIVYAPTSTESWRTGVPDHFALLQNFPNPFNPSTTLRYSLPTRAYVTLTVFNALGQQVAVLQNGEQEAGYHEAVFDASGLASGVCLYRLTAGSFVETRKLLLVR